VSPDKVGSVNQKKLGPLIAAMAVSMAATVLYVPAVGSTLPSKSNSKIVPVLVPVEAIRLGMLNWVMLGADHEFVIASDSCISSQCN